MTLGDLYREKMRLVEMWQKLKEGKTPLVRMDFNERASSFASSATSLAHCVMKFGDVELSSLDIPKLREHAFEDCLPDCCPWLTGLFDVEEYLAKNANTVTTDPDP